MTKQDNDIAAILGIGQKKRRPWGWIGLGVVAVAAVGLWVMLQGDAGSTKVSYVTDAVRKADIEVTVAATGTVEPTDLVEISSELSGTIESVEVDYNDSVAVGAVLARLDTSRLESQLEVQKASLASAEAKIVVAEATVKEARDTYERGLQLEKRGVETTQTLIGQEATYARAKAELLAAEAARDLAKANLDVVQVDLDKSCICSPVAGVVLDRDVDPGQIVAASLSAPILFQVAEDLRRMELQVDIDEADIGRVRVGQTAIFTVDAYDDRSFPAEISQLRYASETVDGVVTYKGILTLDNSDMALRPGMTATADIVVASVKDTLVVPNAALRYSPPAQVQEEGESRGSGLVGMIMPRRSNGNGAGTDTAGKSVWVLRDEGPAEVVVVTGDSDGSVTAILEGALEVGDMVITDRIDAE
ncbi:MAG: efflux RND transporter periplasmic adaptor subunit [Rhodobacteraceae bacterium]|nr:efflux RND transporter periplasmic adaptor subunit [Paracoccaceae bacterium]